MAKAKTNYPESIRLLRHYFGERAFPASRGYGLRSQSEAARHWIRRHAALVHALQSIQSYPVKEISGSDAARAQRAAPARVVVQRRGRRGPLKWRRIPILVGSKSARIHVTKRGRVGVADGKLRRWYYPLDARERAMLALDPYEFLSDLARREGAARVTLQIWGNVISEAYSVEDLELRGRGVFGSMMSGYRRDPARYEQFFGGVSGVWLFSRGFDASEWGSEIEAARRAWRESMKRARAKRPSRRARLTGRM